MESVVGQKTTSDRVRLHRLAKFFTPGGTQQCRYLPSPSEEHPKFTTPSVVMCMPQGSAGLALEARGKNWGRKGCKVAIIISLGWGVRLDLASGWQRAANLQPPVRSMKRRTKLNPQILNPPQQYTLYPELTTLKPRPQAPIVIPPKL